ncbi:MAG: hypothetical protein CMG00_07195 [Candidatus Marinimicrobia bacterium]|nr:hypothetical protein [Candidatus Neomarinimicrobiota bacterium]|tara:strand:- start:27816 stop:30734 length:2919 start_codon:yes stop_codon:yes gene_type:complete
MNQESLMKKYKNVLAAVVVVVIIIVGFNRNQKNNKQDPLKVQTYILDNGLTVYLNEDHNTTSVFGAIAVRGGSKRDPKDATGIAHYLEHLLFKGTEQMGTIDFESEKIFLDSIEFKYEELGQTSNEKQRLKIQSDINKLSLKASEYAIPNEFDRIMESIGGSWVNAYTTPDAIVYLNKFPGDQINKWLEIYSHRFVNPVFRLFQSELETVYEEKNRSLDSFFRQLFEAYFDKFFKNHPYGQQTTLGSVEHLKNPSLSKMKQYFDDYYVANNMALIITGDIDVDKVLPIIKEKFGGWKRGKNQSPVNIKEEDFKGREFISKNMTPIKIGTLGFRTAPAAHKDNLILEVCSGLLTNESRTGLIDELVINGKIQDAGIYNMDFVDHGGTMFYFVPTQGGQSLGDAEALLMSQVEKLKRGDFSDQSFNALKLSMIRQYEEALENMEGRLFSLIDTYIKDYSWKDVIDWPKKLDKVSKKNVVEIANKYFNDNYLVMHSNEGSIDKYKLEKPPFKPVIPKNSEASSQFAKDLKLISEGELNLQFIEFDKDIKFKDIKKNVHLYHTYNPINSIFNLTFQYGVGTLENPMLDQTADLLNMLGTSTYKFDDFKKELQEIGTAISFSTSKDYFNINIKGFDKNIVKSLEYLSEFIKNVKGDDEKIKILADNAKTERKVENEEPSTIGEALSDFVMWGDQSYYLRRLNIGEVENSESSDYIDAFNNAMKYELDILYTGQIDLDTLSSHISRILVLPEDSFKSNSPVDLIPSNINKNVVYVIHDGNAVQSQIYFGMVSNPVNQKLRNQSKAYNKYFSGGMSSIVFQEIREFRSLAYSSWGYFRRPWRNSNPGVFIGYVGCQTDKTLESISTFKEILINMPQKPERIEQVQSSLIKSINSERPNFRAYPSIVSNWKKMGYINDPRKNQVEYFKNMSFSEIVDFQKNQIAVKPLVISILTDTNRVSMKGLKQYGEMIILNKKDILN